MQADYVCPRRSKKQVHILNKTWKLMKGITYLQNNFCTMLLKFRYPLNEYLSIFNLYLKVKKNIKDITNYSYAYCFYDGNYQGLMIKNLVLLRMKQT